MKYLIFILLTSLIIISCSFLTEDEIVLTIPARIPLEEITNESIYYTLRYFDGERIVSRHIPHHAKKLSVSVKKGYLSLFLLYPAEDFTPLAAYHEPGDSKSITFSYSPSSLIEFLCTVASESPALVGNLSLSRVLSRYKADEINKMEFLKSLEKGKLGLYDIVKAESVDVSIESLVYGRWYSERDDKEDLIVKESAESITLSFYEGVYIYIHEGLEKMLTVVVTDSGEHISKVESFRRWY